MKQFHQLTVMILMALTGLLFSGARIPATAQTQVVQTETAATNSCSILQTFGQCAILQPISENEYQVGGVLYMQTAAEYRALAYQAFNLARHRLDLDLERKLPKRLQKIPRAVVVDVDETVLDNSAFQAYLIKRRMAYVPDAFTEWVKMRKAKKIPGAVEFLAHAAKNRVKVFYVTSRNTKEKEGTIGNLKDLGFPDASDETVLVRTDTSSKEPRRQWITQKYRIVLLIGDNLNDLSEIFERKSIQERFEAVDKVRASFGENFILLPNAIYGAWEDALYDYKRDLTESQKEEKRNTALTAFQH